MEYKFVRSWAKFVCRAAADNITSIWELLLRYSSLVQPPPHIKQFLQYLVVTMQTIDGSIAGDRLVPGAQARVLSSMASFDLVRLRGGARHA